MLHSDVVGNLIKPKLHFYTPNNIRKPEFSENFRGYRNGKLA